MIPLPSALVCMANPWVDPLAITLSSTLGFAMTSRYHLNWYQMEKTVYQYHLNWYQYGENSIPVSSELVPVLNTCLRHASLTYIKVLYVKLITCIIMVRDTRIIVIIN